VISFEDCTFADAVVGWEFNALGQRRKRLFKGLADAADVNRDRGHTETRLFAAQNLGDDPAGDYDPFAEDDGMSGVALVPSGFRFIGVKASV
jgi:hypothetical protein